MLVGRLSMDPNSGADRLAALVQGHAEIHAVETRPELPTGAQQAVEMEVGALQLHLCLVLHSIGAAARRTAAMAFF
jgi:hypothetical protein